jgi:topoisomerase IA-like protein
MSELKIQCPKCSNEIELTEQLAGPMVADLQASFSVELAKREAQAAEALVAAKAQAKEAAKAETSAEQMA